MRIFFILSVLTLFASCTLDTPNNTETTEPKEITGTDTTDTPITENTMENPDNTDVTEVEIASITEDESSFIESAEAKLPPLYSFPDESEPHEATWLQWPHQYQYGIEYRDSLDQTWIDMTRALVGWEKVSIIAYDEAEKSRITGLLTEAWVPLTSIEFTIAPTDDVWVRDNGPIYVRDRKWQLVIEDWGFNGWGDKVESEKCDTVPDIIAKNEWLRRIDINNLMINEWGSIEMDGHGTLMATRSSILNKNRNPGMSEKRANAIFRKYLGITNVIWLDGVAGMEITDMHIDGFVRFADHGKKLITMSEDNLTEWWVPDSDIDKIYSAKNLQGIAYEIVTLPLTKKDVTTEYGKKLDYKGSYLNYYIANGIVLVPNYMDEHDRIANEIIGKLYPERKVIGIDVRNLYENGGMIHCVTQQKPKK